MGQHGVDAETRELARTWLAMFKDAAERIAQSLGLELDAIDFTCDYATAAERVDLGWFVLEKGTNAAVRGRWDGKIGGETRLRTQITWYLTPLLSEGWEIDDTTYSIQVDGAPNLRLRIGFSDPPPSPTDGAWDENATTSAAAINAIAQIVAAPATEARADGNEPYLLRRPSG